MVPSRPVLAGVGINGLSLVTSILTFVLFSVSEAPKAAPIARKYDSRHELEEVKTTEQQKEEVSEGKFRQATRPEK